MESRGSDKFRRAKNQWRRRGGRRDHRPESNQPARRRRARPVGVVMASIIIASAIGLLVLCAIVRTVLVVMHDDTGPIPYRLGYDTRRPVP